MFNPDAFDDEHEKRAFDMAVYGMTCDVIEDGKRRRIDPRDVYIVPDDDDQDDGNPSAAALIILGTQAVLWLTVVGIGWLLSLGGPK